MRAFVTLLASAVVATVVAAVPPAHAAAAPAPAQLPVTELGDWAVDVPHGHVYITGTGAGGLYVRDLAGAEVATVFRGQGARGLMLSDDGNTLYVALAGAGAVAAMDTTTLAETGRWSTGAAACPTDVAELGTQLWFLYGCATYGESLGVVERAGEAPAVSLAREPVTVRTGSRNLLAAPGNRLVVSDPFNARVFVLTVDGTTATKTAEAVMEAHDLALTPDGTGLMVAATRSARTYSVHTLPYLAFVSSHGSAREPRAVAAAGDFVVTAGADGERPDVHVWRTDGSAIRTADLPVCCSDATVPPSVVAGGAELSPDGTTLYVLTSGGAGHALWLHTITGATSGASTITLAKPTAPRIRVAYTVTGRVTSTRPITGSQVLRVFRVSRFGTVALPDVTTDADGRFSFGDTVRRRGTYTYRVTWTGDATHLAGVGRTTFHVLGLTPAMSIATNARTYRYGATARVVAHLGMTYANRALRISAKPYGAGVQTVAVGTVDANGHLRGSQGVSRRTVFSATFAGDDVYEPRTVTRTVAVGVFIKQYPADFHARSGTYWLYRRDVDPNFHLEVVPSRPGTCMAFVAQRYTAGAWRTFASNTCLRLGVYSIVAATVRGAHPVGVPHRVRSTFVGDASNARTVGAWVYLKFVE